jgi:hypothetical protein
MALSCHVSRFGLMARQTARNTRVVPHVRANFQRLLPHFCPMSTATGPASGPAGSDAVGRQTFLKQTVATTGLITCVVGTCYAAYELISLLVDFPEPCLLAVQTAQSSVELTQLVRDTHVNNKNHASPVPAAACAGAFPWCSIPNMIARDGTLHEHSAIGRTGGIPTLVYFASTNYDLHTARWILHRSEHGATRAGGGRALSMATRRPRGFRSWAPPARAHCTCVLSNRKPMDSGK